MRLLREIGRLRRGRLHPVGQLKAGDPGGQIGLRRPAGGMGRVELAEEIEIGALGIGRLPPPPHEIVDRLAAAGIDRQRLIALGEEASRPDLIVPPRLALMHHDKAGEIVVHRAEPVAEPGPHARHAGAVEPAHQLHRRRGMVIGTEMAGMDKRHVIHMPGKMRKQIAHPAARLPMLRPLEGAGQTCPAGLKKPDLFVGIGERLAGPGLQLRLIVPGINLRRRAGHEEPNHPLRFGRMVRQRQAGASVMHTRGAAAAEQLRKSQGTKSQPAVAQELASSRQSQFPQPSWALASRARFRLLAWVHGISSP